MIYLQEIYIYYHICWAFLLKVFDNFNITRIYSNYITYTVCYSRLYFEPKLANIL